MAADTAALIEHLGLGPCDVIGYSLGGYIAQELAVTRADLVRRLVLLAGAGPAPAFAVARARAAVDLARALDPPPPSFDVADLLLSLHPMAQLQDDDDAVKITISLIEAAEPWTNPGRLGQYQADLAWLEDSSHLDRLGHIESPAWPWHSSTTAGSPRGPCAKQPNASPAASTPSYPAWATAPPCWPPTRSTPSSPSSSGLVRGSGTQDHCGGRLRS